MAMNTDARESIQLNCSKILCLGLMFIEKVTHADVLCTYTLNSQNHDSVPLKTRKKKSKHPAVFI